MNVDSVVFFRNHDSDSYRYFCSVEFVVFIPFITVDVSFKTLTSAASTLMVVLRLVPTPLGPIYAAVQLDTVWLLTGTHVKVDESDYTDSTLILL